MVSRPPDSDDPTSEEEALEFDGTQDDRGQPHWKWVSELGPAATDASETFDQVRALENPYATGAADSSKKRR